VSKKAPHCGAFLLAQADFRVNGDDVKVQGEFRPASQDGRHPERSGTATDRELYAIRKQGDVMKMKAILVATVIGLGAAPLISQADTAPATKSEAGQYVSDSAITAKVKSALLAEKGLKSTDISVETQNGVVQLSGFVVSSAQTDQAVDVAKHVKGVKDVKNDLRLKSTTE
jgi:hyperosmotically inducible protein